MFKFLHAADIHLDSPLLGLPINEIRVATREALKNLVQLAIDRQVNFVVIAGDVYDGNWRDSRTGEFFIKEMFKLRDACIPVFLISGNHDAENKMTKDLRLPDNVVRLSAKRPETKPLEDYSVCIHGQGFATAAVTENLAAAYPRAVPGNFNIGLLHTSAEVNAGHPVYADCRYDDLRNKEYDYWALGHIHQRGRVWGDDRIHFSGNIQGRHIRETGAKGCLLVTVDDANQATTEFEPLDVWRWEKCRVDASDCARGYDVLDRAKESLGQLIGASEGRRLAVRVDVVGACPVHDELRSRTSRWTDEIRLLASDVGQGEVWIEKIGFHTSLPRAIDLSADDDGLRGELVRYIGELSSHPAALSALAEECLADLWRKLPAQVKDCDDALRLDDTAALRRLLDDVPPLLMSRLLDGARP